MKFGLMYANAGPFAYPEGMTNLARTAEAAGIESLWTVEHVVIPVGYKSTYPYDPSGKIPAPDSMPIPDPLLWLASAAAVTKTIRLATGILILPQRHPLYVAKEVATLDVLSGGRAILGIGVGWLLEEFNALGIPFDDRGSRTAETVRAMRSLWKDEPEAFEGRFFKWAPLQSHPKPIQKPGVPIVVGGHTALSAKRAARYGDADQLTAIIKTLRDECKKLGRRPEEVEISAGRRAIDLDSVKRYQDLGVSRIMIPPPAFDPDGIRQGLGELADKVISRL